MNCKQCKKKASIIYNNIKYCQSCFMSEPVGTFRKPGIAPGINKKKSIYTKKLRQRAYL